MAGRARLLIAPAVAVLLCGTPPAWAQAPKVFKVAILTNAFSPWHSHTEGLRDGLKEFGYVEGKNVTFEARATQGDTSRLPELASELVGLKPDLLYCNGTAAAQVCAKTTERLPILFAEVGDPVRLGLVKSLARPGGNITGMANLRPELTAKRLELFKETVPSLRRVLVTYDLRQPEDQESVAVARTAAGRLGLTLLERPITASLEMEPGLGELREGGRDGILIVQSGPHLNIPGRSLEVATSNNIPTMYPASFWTKVGALASYGPDQYLQGRQAARLAHRVLSGTHPAALPVELPDRIEFVVNAKTAKRLGLQIPRTILLRADRMIE
ncbi:MAG: ABC transporter substrate-binding protein [Candidatus Rokubacteria bacterium]|nr:ABC transporter substrate-binding protein [Candidatus Rokubacteria bacterium]